MTQTVLFQGKETRVSGKFLEPGNKAPSFKLVGKNLSEHSLSDFAGKHKILNIFPSIDTGVCAASVRRFNQSAAELHNTVVLCISADLPFAQSRFCGAENLNNVITLSAFRDNSFKHAYGVDISEGMLRGLTARAVLVLNQQDEIVYSELVSEMTTEPNYEAALDALKKL
ncbi:thiol peroxidase [Candidatus Williamhamiltonella defendens]|uniref:Thiol peroxidase n=1 Tax=Candidatus Hamiltonella defensa (Bemisia tabaci) TaxID=672795 RepID=A0A0E4C2B8_9ENTR|nr:thiol peroxidase [Candidatus Hamiltonella defensa]ASX26284.1 lipid hydroperoxide peroxidase [Candidatus Hamiltonella defensa (Bemisia tabaci)]CED79380.1 Thiol peroxidase [Candidatus Hamiltonella defensa (Bemisia tabaci)]CED79444.1 Thiol peroxidase [Candidatus Hamiltonella defensa (Bemisia tabaci)]